MRDKHQRGFSFIELLIVMAIVGGLMAVVSITASKIYLQARETAALSHVHTLLKAQTQYYSMKRQFAPTLQDLGPAKARLIAENLAAGNLGGYLFEVAGTEESFVIKARPERQGKSGNANFYADDTLVIRQNDVGLADRESPPIK